MANGGGGDDIERIREWGTLPSMHARSRFPSMSTRGVHKLTANSSFAAPHV
jgi:hypothetical protein